MALTIQTAAFLSTCFTTVAGDGECSLAGATGLLCAGRFFFSLSRRYGIVYIPHHLPRLLERVMNKGLVDVIEASPAYWL